MQFEVDALNANFKSLCRFKADALNAKFKSFSRSPLAYEDMA
eukprot:gene18592-25104_t